LFNYQFQSRVRSDQEEDAFLAFTTLDELDLRLAELHGNLIPNQLVLFEAPPLHFKATDKILAMGKGRTLMYKSGCEPAKLDQALKAVIGEGVLDNLATAITTPSKDKNPSWTLRRPVAAPAFDVLFSLMIPEPERFHPQWKIEEAIENYVAPMLKDISDLFDVSIKSQILYLTSLNLKTKSSGENFVTADDLGLAINVDSQLSSHVSSKPTLNFLTYIPTIKQSPLKIQDSNGDVTLNNAFLVPRWGGVVILNTNNTDLDMHHMMSVYVSQFRSLIGLDYFNQDLVFKVGQHKTNINQVERDFLLRLGCVENLAVARLTMQGLSHLLTQISNIVINEEISKEVYLAVSDYQDSIKLAAEATKLEAAFHSSKKSFLSAEKAFYDDTLLALLYFPEDQKYAIYIPLFLPITISFMGSFLPFMKKRFGK
jgi:phosphatidylinositol glycan class S